MTTALYEIGTSESDDGSTHPAECIWTPGEDAEEAAESGFVIHRSLYIAGIDDPTDHPYPVGFLALGHHRWGDVIEGAAAYMARVYGWRTLHLYPGHDPVELIPRIPRAVQTWGVFLRHPHPDHSCGYEWDDTWRMVWAPATEPGAVPITALRHPAAPAAAAGLPNPEEGAPAIWAA
ncbi:hypothetical protein ACIF6I_33420 [Streptomyces microflavus]|uniref:hypothetical protein n=1 Tax=Streptomyces microflavus TaxID=1919 RepID=UPI0037D5365C